MRSRLLVAAIGIPIVYLCVWAGWQMSLVFAILVAVAVGIAVLEFCELMREYQPYVPAALLATLVTPLLAWQALEPGIFAGLVMTIPLTMIFASLSVRRGDPGAAIVVTFAGVGYIAIPAGLAVVLRASPHGFDLILLMLACIWLTDTGAYFVGRAFGRHKLAPRISPNKTIEGFIGGTVLGTFALWFGHYLTGGVDGASGPWLSGGAAAALGLSVSLATTVGDLFESMLKRSVGVKDSGHLLGEHGGMLDRLDALFVAIPVMYLMSFLVGAL